MTPPIPALAAALLLLLPGLAGARTASGRTPAVVPGPRVLEPAASGLGEWAELELRLDVRGAAVELDTGHFCPLSCRLLLPPGEHTFTVRVPDREPLEFRRTFEAGRTLLLEPDPSGGEDEIDGWGIALYTVGAALMLTGVSLLAYDVVENVGNAGDDWTLAYTAAGLTPLGLILAIWGAARREEGSGIGWIETVVPSSAAS